MFVGVGASRVRDLFANAKESAPAILFIDEIDAVGRHRGAGLGGGHDEREQTLNQILSEMDGFTQNDSRDRDGRHEPPRRARPRPPAARTLRSPRHRRPAQRKGRRAIFVVHTRDVPLADDVDLDRLAAGTVGLTGADIRNLVNEAALWATRQGKERVEMDDFEYARDKVLMGTKREEVLIGKEKSDDRLPRGGPRPAGLAGPRDRPAPQGFDHPARPIARGHAALARGRPCQHQRRRTTHPALVSAGRPRGREARLR